MAVDLSTFSSIDLYAHMCMAPIDSPEYRAFASWAGFGPGYSTTELAALAGMAKGLVSISGASPDILEWHFRLIDPHPIGVSTRATPGTTTAFGDNYPIIPYARSRRFSRPAILEVADILMLSSETPLEYRNFNIKFHGWTFKMRVWFKVVLMLNAAYARACERVYAPEGLGAQEAAAEFMQYT